VNKTFGDVIVEKLKALKITQKQLATKAGIDVSYVNKIIKNRTTNPSYAIVINISNILNITEEELYNIFNINTKNIEDNLIKEQKTTTLTEKELINKKIKLITEQMTELKADIQKFL